MCLRPMRRRRSRAMPRSSKVSRCSHHSHRNRQRNKVAASSRTPPRAADSSSFAKYAMQIQLHGVVQLRQRRLTARHTRFHVNGGGSLHHLLHYHRSSVHFFA
jgi:hypothetical protein